MGEMKIIVLLILLLFIPALFVSGGENGSYKILDGKDFSLLNDEAVLFLGQDIENVFLVLGNDYSENIIKSKSNEKWDYISFEYKNFKISYTRGWESINKMLIYGNSMFETVRGIGIGSTLDEVKIAYKGVLFIEHNDKLFASWEWFDDMGIIATTYYISFSYSDDLNIDGIELGTTVD